MFIFPLLFTQPRSSRDVGVTLSRCCDAARHGSPVPRVSAVRSMLIDQCEMLPNVLPARVARQPAMAGRLAMLVDVVDVLRTLLQLTRPSSGVVRHGSPRDVS